VRALEQETKADICPETGEVMVRGVRSMPLEFKGEEVTFDMPGWYCESVDDGIHSGEDVKVSDHHLELLKASKIT